MMANNKIVSVIIPTYNRGKYLPRAIVSVLSQSYNNFELIVVDDASTDNTAEIVNSIDDPRLKYICHDQNKGGAAARNTGIKAAKGDYIAFQDSDDEWMPEKLAKQMDVFIDCAADVGAVYCSYLMKSENRSSFIPAAHIVRRNGNILLEILAESFIGTPTLVVRRDIFDKIGLFDENLSRFQDWDMAIRIAQEYHFQFIDEQLVTAYGTLDSISQNVNSVRSWQAIFEKHFQSIKQHAHLLAKHYGALGHLHTMHISSLDGCRYFLKSIGAYPAYFKSWAGLLMALPGRGVYLFLLRLVGRV